MLADMFDEMTSMNYLFAWFPDVFLSPLQLYMS